MTIVSSQIHKIINKQGGRKKLMMQCTDHLGKIWERRTNVPANSDHAQFLADWVATQDDNIIQQEKDYVKSYIEEGGDPAELVVDYLTNRQKAICIVRGMMRAEEPIIIMPAAEHIQNNITNTQLQNFFGAAKGTRIRNRTDAIVASKSFLEADKSLVEEV